MVRGSISRLRVLLWILLSMRAANKLLAFSTALKSPVKWRLISSMGITCAYPPPAAPPLIPNTGPKEGSLNTGIAFFPILFKPSARPTDVVVFPSPAGVGLMAVTRMSLPVLIFSSLISFNGSLALYLP